MTPLSREIVDWAGHILAGPARGAAGRSAQPSVIDAGLALMHAIHDEFTYDGSATPPRLHRSKPSANATACVGISPM
jgi:hypothetical protein